MNEHLESGQLQAMLDQELEPAEARVAREHLVTCIDCRRRMAAATEANEVLTEALSLLVPPRAAPPVRALSAPPSTERGGWRGSLVSLRAAAMLVIFAAGASATIPGSPVREWLFGDEEIPATAPAPMATRATPEVAVPAAGVGVEPADGELRIVLESIATGVEIRASIVEQARGGVYGDGEASAGRFRSGAGSIQVSDVPGGSLSIEIPRAATAATVELNGEVRLVKAGDRLELTAEADDSAATQVLLQVQ